MVQKELLLQSFPINVGIISLAGVQMAVFLFTPRRHSDERGWFCEVYKETTWLNLDLPTGFVQDNQSLSHKVGTVRGLHFQVPPRGQIKLVRCVRGRLFDVAVDVRRGSPTYGAFVSAELTEERGEQLYIPIGFAHGFMTLEPGSEVAYKVSDYYAPECDGGICWSDPDLRIPWPIAPGQSLFSPKDALLPLLKDFESPFAYDGRPLELIRI